MTPEDQLKTPLAHLQQRGLNHRQRLQTIARRHVGGAALEQTAAVEGIIAAGREQLEIADALREVMALTLHEVRAASLEQIQTAAPQHTTMLREMIQAGRDQLDVAALLQDVINQALERVTKIPPEEVNLNTLRQIQRQVHEQIGALEHFIRVVRQHVSSAEDIAQLGQLGDTLHGRLNHLQHVEAVDKLIAFEQVSESALIRIMTVENAQPADRIAALKQLIATAQEQLAVLEGGRHP